MKNKSAILTLRNAIILGLISGFAFILSAYFQQLLLSAVCHDYSCLFLLIPIAIFSITFTIIIGRQMLKILDNNYPSLLVIFANLAMVALMSFSSWIWAEASLLTQLSLFIPSYILLYFLFILTFTTANLSKKYRISLSVLIIIVLSLAGKFYLPNLLSELTHYQYRNMQNSKIEKLSFDIYTPTYLPVGYRLKSVDLANNYKSETENTYLNLDYGNMSIHEYKYRDGGYFSPPDNCGLFFPSTINNPCVLVGQTSTGREVYVVPGQRAAGYIRIDNTVIVLEASAPIDNLYTQITNEEIIRIFDSLKKTTAEEISSQIGDK